MSFWADKRFLVTGGSGFLGQALLEKMAQRGAVNVSAPRSSAYDLREVDAVKAVLDDTQPDVVIHLAAVVGGIGANRAHPAEFLYENLVMGVHLMHEAWARGIEKFVTIGTVCAYPKFVEVPFREETIWDGYPEETNAPYGLAKKMLLVQGQSYQLQYDFNAIYLLPTNLYGPRDNFDLETSHVIPALIRKCMEAQERGDAQIIAWGTGSPTREFLYVDDAAEGILLATERYNSAEPVNLGSSEEISIKNLLETIAELTGFEGEIVWDADKPDGQPRRSLDTSRATQEFSFRAQVPFREGLRRTIDWYVANRENIQSGVNQER